MNLNDQQKKIVRFLFRFGALPLFFLFCFFVFTLLLFPYAKLRDYLVYSFNAQQRATNGQFELHIDDVGPWWRLPGIKAKGVHLKSLQSDPSKPPVEIDIEEVRGRVSVLPLLILRKSVSFQLDAFSGHVDGSAVISSSERHVTVELDGVELGEVEIVAAQLGLPLSGKISGKVDLFLPEGKASKGNGTVTLEGTEIAVSDGKTPFVTPVGPMKIPKLDVGSLSIVGEAKDGKLQISKLAATGKDIELSGEGTIRMREMAAESLCDIALRFKINDSYRGREDMTKSLFGDPSKTGMAGQGLIDMDPKMKKAKQPDGFYAFRIGNKLGRMSFDAAGAVPTTPTTGGGALTGGGAIMGGGGAGRSGGLRGRLNAPKASDDSPSPASGE